MKNLVLASVAAVACMAFAHAASAHDSTGCGLGSMAWRGESGVVPQVLAVTTNGTFGTQTFGISSGTSGCDPNGRITGGTQKMIHVFLENNMEQFAFDASRGEGETLYTIAGMLNMPVDQVAAASKEHFNELFPDQNVQVLAVSEKLFQILKVQVV